MGHGYKSCVLCQRAEETKITGALSTKENVTAHQNCLLFSSGIYCRDSPHSDDLFGFSVDDVKEEVRRGRHLLCNRCRRKGATVGCEVKRCKKSYHYLCAIEEGGMPIEEADVGKYVLFCARHYQLRLEKSVNGHASPSSDLQTSNNDSEAGPSKKNTSGDLKVTAAGPSGYSSDTNSFSGPRSSDVKRQLTFNGKQEEPPSKRKPEQWNGMVTDDSSDADENEPDMDMAEFAPLESDIDGSAESQTAHQPIRNTQSPTGSRPGNQVVDESKDGLNSDNESDAESESLLPPVRSTGESEQHSMTSDSQLTAHSVFLIEADEVINGNGKEFSNNLCEHTAKPSVPPQRSSAPTPCPEISRPCIVTSQDTSPAPRSPHPEPSMNSEIFWRSCNAAGCTQAIFTDFINQMSNISGRILSGQASQEDYDMALKVMESSGKLAEMVTMQQKELEKKQMELRKAAAAMKEAISALRK